MLHMENGVLHKERDTMSRMIQTNMGEMPLEDYLDILPEKSNSSNIDYDKILWDILKKHSGHKVSIVSYGNYDNPENISLECEDCGEVILDAELYTICAREDI